MRGSDVKAAKFEYLLASSTDEAVAALAAGDGEAIVLAGGQTLLPLLAMRLARPALLVDINDVAALAGIEEGADEIVIGACTRQAATLASPVVAEHLPLIAQALAHVGHQQTRNRGTIGGSLAHGDPAAELPLAALALGAELNLRSTAGERRLPIAGFYTGPMMTARAADELVVAVHVPKAAPGARVGTGFHEVAERHGDFAIAAAAARIELDADDVCTRAALAVGGVDAVPRRMAGVEERLTGARIDDDAVGAAVPAIAAAVGDADAQRLRLAQRLAERAILEAGARAGTL